MSALRTTAVAAPSARPPWTEFSHQRRSSYHELIHCGARTPSKSSTLSSLSGSRITLARRPPFMTGLRARATHALTARRAPRDTTAPMAQPLDRFGPIANRDHKHDQVPAYATPPKHPDRVALHTSLRSLELTSPRFGSPGLVELHGPPGERE